jgi:hypothetical protein
MTIFVALNSPGVRFDHDSSSYRPRLPPTLGNDEIDKRVADRSTVVDSGEEGACQAMR